MVKYNVFWHFCVEVKDQEPTEPPGLMGADNSSRQHRYASGQYFFEYLVVVSLKKTKDGSSYEPQITYQFPKVSLNLQCHLRDTDKTKRLPLRADHSRRSLPGN